MRYPNEYDIRNYEWISLTPRGDWGPFIENFNVYSLTSTEVELSEYFYDTVINNSFISSLQSREGPNDILTPERLSKMWYIPLHIAKEIPDVTTSKSLRVTEGKLS